MLADAGAELTLAYVRHTTQTERDREELEEHEAEALLERGARWLGDLEVERRVVVSASTGEGLKWLAEQEQADIIVFGSDYRTAAGHVAPQHSAQTLLEGGPAAVAIAPANYRADRDPQITHDRRARRARATRPRSRPRASSPTGWARSLIARRAQRRPAGRRLARRGARGPRDDHRAGAERDRERDLRRCWSSPRGVPVRFAAPVTSPEPALTGRTSAAAPARLSWRRACGRSSSPTCTSAVALGHDVLTRPSRCERLLAALDGVDRLVLLGDIVELLEGRPEHAMAVAEPVLAAIGRAARDRRARSIVVPGNHDAPLVRAGSLRGRARADPDTAVPLDATPARWRA